jgi:hypothetical protein
MDPQDLLRGVLAPGALVGALLLVFWGLASKAARRDLQAPGAAAAAAIPWGMLLGMVLLYGFEVRPLETWRWMDWLCIAIAPLAALAAQFQAREHLRRGLHVAMVAAALGLVLRKRIFPDSGAIAWDKLALYFFAALFVIALWRRLLPRLGAVGGAAALWFLASATAAMLLFSGSLKFAMCAAALAGALGALLAACWLRPSLSGMSGAIAPVALLLSTLVFLGFEFAYSPSSPWLFLGIALAPAVLFVPLLRNNTMRGIGLAIPVCTVLNCAWRAYSDTGY